MFTRMRAGVSSSANILPMAPAIAAGFQAGAEGP